MIKQAPPSFIPKIQRVGDIPSPYTSVLIYGASGVKKTLQLPTWPKIVVIDVDTPQGTDERRIGGTVTLRKAAPDTRVVIVSHWTEIDPTLRHVIDLVRKGEIETIAIDSMNGMITMWQDQHRELELGSKAQGEIDISEVMPFDFTKWTRVQQQVYSLHKRLSRENCHVVYTCQEKEDRTKDNKGQFLKAGTFSPELPSEVLRGNFPYWMHIFFRQILKQSQKNAPYWVPYHTKHTAGKCRLGDLKEEIPASFESLKSLLE